MAKKKSSKKLLGSILSGVTILFAIVALCMMFVKSVKVMSGENEVLSFTGAQTVFGYTWKKEVLGTTLSAKILDFSFMNLLPYLLLLAGILFAALGYEGKSGFLMNILATAAFVVAAVFFFLAPQFVVVAESGSSIVDSAVNSIVSALKDDGATVAIGGILAGVFSAIAAVCSGLKIFVK